MSDFRYMNPSLRRLTRQHIPVEHGFGCWADLEPKLHSSIISYVLCVSHLTSVNLSPYIQYGRKAEFSELLCR